MTRAEMWTQIQGHEEVIDALYKIILHIRGDGWYHVRGRLIDERRRLEGEIINLREKMEDETYDED
jgi:hypothetical protein